MRRTARFVLVLVAGLGLLTCLAYITLVRTTRGWFDAEMRLRSGLAVMSARQSLALHWDRGDVRGITAVLTDIAHDERVMGAAACSESGATVASTHGYPRELGCAPLRSQMQGRAAGGAAEPWTTTVELPRGAVHVTLVGLNGSGSARSVVLLHDLSYLNRREDTTRQQLLVAFLVLALGASAVTIVAARIAFRNWLRELRAAISGRPSREFQPLVRDLRDLVEGISLEKETDPRAGGWTPERLRVALMQHLQGERVVIVANREPYIHERTEDGGVRVVHPASGLVTALEPVLRACSGVWIAHGGGSADRETVDAHDRLKVPPGEESYSVRRVWLSEAEEQGYYYGFSNEGLWPLCHVAHTRPQFRGSDFDEYSRVNERFAKAVCEEVDVEDPIVLVQDYHFALAPRMIRERLPRATILTFWHIPWPNAERFGICPWRSEILQGLLGSSIVGFHTRQHCNNFLDAADTFLEARIDRESNAVVQHSRKTLVRPYPISIEWPVHWLAGVAPAQECRRSVFAELELKPDALLGVGVDRLDYTKGIEERLLTTDELLSRFPEYRGRFTFVQLAAPSRTRIDRYRELNDRIEALTASINAKWGEGDYRPIVLLRAHHEPPSVFRYLRAADVCYVSSLHDGMNLVAKEFVAARDDERGVLVLSQFTGAARELTEALIVNPYDLRQASDAMVTALRMPAEEQAERMRSMRALVSHFNVYRWAGRMLADAALLRQRERLVGRFTSSHAPALSR